ncbi:EF-hand domain-containing protein [Hyphomonas sp.]|uniref:EF-hand domain-containing protein n=1 Tax=Hyphomonas sp. TaxID=87 RepID=UPI003D2AEE93|tara:strand:+ start:607 stop:1122 length:516 start_codon:yes stop_codon:yes gene_type:complete
MKRTTLASLIGAAAIVVAVPFAAQAERGHGWHDGSRGEHMKAVDTNGDGDITREEVDAFRATMFNAADANKDGSLSLAEMTAHHEAQQAQRKAERQARHFAKLDTDGDGQITAAEFASRPMRGMERMDTDGDGVVTEEERAAAKAAMKERHGKWGKRGQNRDVAPDAPDAE